jgi:hypothetical protein
MAIHQNLVFNINSDLQLLELECKSGRSWYSRDTSKNKYTSTAVTLSNLIANPNIYRTIVLYYIPSQEVSISPSTILTVLKEKGIVLKGTSVGEMNFQEEAYQLLSKLVNNV